MTSSAPTWGPSVILLALAAVAAGAALPRGTAWRYRVALAALAAGIGLAGWGAVATDPSDGGVPSPPAEAWAGLPALLMGLPFAGAVTLVFLPRQLPALLRGTTYLVTGATFVAALQLFQTEWSPGWHHQSAAPWIEPAGIRWHVGLDGVSAVLVLLVTLLVLVVAYASFGSVQARLKEWSVALLTLEGAAIGAFVALDLFLFYVCFELTTIVLVMVVGMWGGRHRVRASVRLFVPALTGSVAMLAALLYLGWAYHELSGQWSFDYLHLSQVMLPGPTQGWGAQTICFWAFSVAFFVRIPLFPFHTWMPAAKAEAPAAGAALLGGVLLSLAVYGYLRFSVGLFPGPARAYAPTLAGGAVVGGVVYGVVAAMKQTDLVRVLAYASLAHLGLVMLGLWGGTPAGTQGAVFHVVSHAVTMSALYLLAGALAARRGATEFSELGGLAGTMPVATALFVVAAMAAIGLPGTSGFIGSFSILVGTYHSEYASDFAGLLAGGAALGLALSAVPLLAAIHQTFFAPRRRRMPATGGSEADLSAREMVAVAPLLAVVVAGGLFPRAAAAVMEPTVSASYEQFNRMLDVTIAKERSSPERARFMPSGVFTRGFLAAPRSASRGGAFAPTAGGTATP
ncbi:MAG: NADH-quinone oxidoreductase subunit M [Myxococcota bacterium]